MSFVSLESRSWLLCYLLVACSSRVLIIAEACPGAATPGPVPSCGTAGASGASGTGGAGGADPAVTFSLNLSASGTARWGDELPVNGAGATMLVALRGERATASAWPADGGGSLQAVGAAITPGIAAPFTDGTSAVGLGSSAPSFRALNAALGDVGSDDFALEVVLRAGHPGLIAEKQTGAGGWSLASQPDGALSLSLPNAALRSEALVSGAWYHCLFWVARGVAGRADCNGRPGLVSDVSSVGDASASAPLTLGGSEGGLELSWLAIFSLKNAPPASVDELTAASRTRFAELTGVRPAIARGSALPAGGVRSSPAFLDLERGGVRRQFLVGPDWPRISCRVDLAGQRQCGYLSEPQRTRFLPVDPSAWAAQELTVAAASDTFTENSEHLSALTPSASNTAHALTFSGVFGGKRQAFSFFARAASGHLIAASVGSVGVVSFDLAAGSVRSAPSGVSAVIEPYGNGLFRCSYVFAPDAGKIEYNVALLDDDASPTFVGDGVSPVVELGGMQLDVGQADAGALLAADLEPADTLTFVGDDGNLPSGTAVETSLQVLLPQGPRLDDEAALSLNLNGDFANQVELYITGDSGTLKFWGLQGGGTHWAFNHPATFTDGNWHGVVASWDTGSAALTVDGVSLTEAALIANEPAFSLNRIDVGFSASSSGALDGLVSALEIRADPP